MNSANTEPASQYRQAKSVATTDTDKCVNPSFKWLQLYYHDHCFSCILYLLLSIIIMQQCILLQIQIFAIILIPEEKIWTRICFVLLLLFLLLFVCLLLFLLLFFVCFLIIYRTLFNAKFCNILSPSWQWNWKGHPQKQNRL